MIVSCPSCRQRYRHEFDVDVVSEPAHCSSCDEHFELAAPKRQYMVVAAGSPPQPVRVPVVQDGVPSPDAVAASSIEIDLPAVEATAVFDAGVPAAETTPAAKPQGDSVPAVRRVASLPGALLEGLVALVPCGVGAGLAYHFAGPMGQDPITWAALGGAIGLLLGWACLLWITHGD